MKTLFAQLKSNGYMVSHIVDFQIYGDNWEYEKEQLELNGVKYIPIDSVDQVQPGDVYDSVNSKFVSPSDPSYDDVKQHMITLNEIDITQNKYFLMASYTDRGILFINKDDIVDIPAKALYSAVNCQLMPNGNFVVNEINKTSKYPFFNNVYLLDKDRNILKSVEIPDGIDHECIVGSNTPRYYSPSFDYSCANENILCIKMSKISNDLIYPLEILDDTIIEMDFDGNIIWQWCCADHFDDFNFTEDEKTFIRRNPIYIEDFGDVYDWIHLNGVCAVGPNKWFNSGDERFNPENIICCSRHRSMIFIISKETGKIVWQIKGSDIDPEFQMPHYGHIIPEGLEGAGNLLLFDNGNWQSREYSRIIEINPITFDVVFTLSEGFYSSHMSSVQKLPDGNYLIGSSTEEKVLVANPDGNIVSESKLNGAFYRINYYPEEWFVEHKYTNAEIQAFYDIMETESKYIPLYKVKLYRMYLDRIINSQQSLLDILSILD